MDKFRLTTYIYHIFDAEKSNALNRDKIVMLIETVHEKDISQDAKLEDIVNAMCQISRALTCKQFGDFCATNQIALSPLILLQSRLRQKVAGEHFWKECASRRAQKPQQLEMHYIANLHEEITHKKAHYKGGQSKGDKSPGKASKKKKQSKEQTGQAKGGHMAKQNSILAGFQNMQSRMSEDAEAAAVAKNKSKKKR